MEFLDTYYLCKIIARMEYHEPELQQLEETFSIGSFLNRIGSGSMASRLTNHCFLWNPSPFECRKTRQKMEMKYKSPQHWNTIL